MRKPRKVLIVILVIIAATVILVAAPIIYIAPIYGCHCNIPYDDYQSVTRYYLGIGGEYVHGHYTFYFTETIGIPIS